MWCTTFNIDYHVDIERHVYSVPFQLVREQVEVRYTTNTVEIFYRGKRLTSHRRRYDGQPSTGRIPDFPEQCVGKDGL